MSLSELGRNDISEETQALKDRLASQDTQNAGLRTQLMRREAELEELQATLNETVYKLSKEAERALQLEEDASVRSSELKTERISLRNAELALQGAQEKLKAEERAKRELESTLDTVSLHSQATSAEHHSVQREKRALEARVRELERIVQTHEAKSVSNIPRKNGRPRSSSVSSFRLPAMEQELNDTKAQLHTKDLNLRALEQKLAQAQDDLVKAENARISIDKASEKRISELLSILERTEEELESLRGVDNAAEREEELLKRIDEDAAKIATLEKLVVESQAARTSQAKIQKLQSQLKAECERAHRSEVIQSQLLREKDELVKQYEASQRNVEEGHQLLNVRERQIQELEAKHACLLVELDTDGRRHAECPSYGTERSSPQLQRPNTFPEFADESALADHIQTLLQAIDRLRGERDELKRALDFSQVEYRITTDGFQAQIASLTQQSKGSTECIAKDNILANASVEQRMKRLTSCATTFAVVVSNIQSHLDFSQDRLSATSADLVSSNSRLHDALAVIEGQKESLDTNTLDRDVLLRKLDAVTKELSESNQERDSLHVQLTDVKGQAAKAVDNAAALEAAMEEAQQNLLSVEQRLATLDKNYQDVESERNSLTLEITNLQDDIARVQDELSDTQNRYNTLHAQQLAAMSTSDVIHALKGRIQELDARLAHRSDQIGDYQHDIRRLEENAKLHEERLVEMTSELELLASQKDAMVEDCAEARGARDEAIEKLEAAEEEVERLQQQLHSTKLSHEAEVSAKSSMISNLTSQNQQTTARLVDLETQKAGFIRELESLGRDHRRLTEELNTPHSYSRSLELEKSEIVELRETVVSLAVVYRVYKDTAQRLQIAHRQITSLESQLEELKQKSSLIDIAEQERQEAAKVLLEDAKAHHVEAEAELLKRIAMMTTAQGRQAEDIVRLREELENAKVLLQNSQENYADLEKLHEEVMQEFAASKEVLERRLTETDAQIRCLNTDRRCSLATLEAKFKRETDMLAINLEDREHEAEELRQKLQDVLEAHTLAEEKLHEELSSHEARHALMNDLEKDLRAIVADLRQRLTQSETETIALQEERQLLQAQITGLEAEIQRSTSLTRYLESQVRESEGACMLLKENLQRAESTSAESEKAGKAAEFNLTLQTTQHEKVVAALRREIASLRSGPELRSALADLEEKNREMDDLLRAKCQEIEEYDDRILGTLKANKKLTNKVESLTRKIQTLQAKLSSVKNQPQETLAKVGLPKEASPVSPPVPAPATMPPGSSSRVQENSASSILRARTPELQSVAVLPSSHTPGRTMETHKCEVSAGKKRPAPDDDERDGVPAEGHYSTDSCLRNGPTPRLRRTHGHPAGFTPVRGASLRKPAGLPSPGRRANAAIPSEVITDVTNSPRGPLGQGDAQLKKRSWLGKVRGGAGSRSASSRLGAFGGQ